MKKSSHGIDYAVVVGGAAVGVFDDVKAAFRVWQAEAEGSGRAEIVGLMSCGCAAEAVVGVLDSTVSKWRRVEACARHDPAAARSAPGVDDWAFMPTGWADSRMKTEREQPKTGHPMWLLRRDPNYGAARLYEIEGRPSPFAAIEFKFRAGPRAIIEP